MLQAPSSTETLDTTAAPDNDVDDRPGTPATATGAAAAAAPIEPLAVDLDQAATLIGVSRSMFYELMKDGKIGPKPVQFGPRCCRFPLSELRAWAATGMPSREQWGRLRNQQASKINGKGS